MSELGERLSGKRVVICAGAGGVGKTTVSAAVALGLAARGQRVAVVTIDPARRLAEALALDELGNEPQRVDPALFAGTQLRLRGELFAMMLDVKRTFDDLIERLAPDQRTADTILTNPVYENISNAVAGSQEYSAVAKLDELVRGGAWEVIVLDTPPSRNAIDFLDAPDRLTAFLEGRAVAGFLRPTGPAIRAAGLMLAALRRVTGGGLLDDLTTFFQLLGGMLGGFRARADDVRRLLTDPATAFLVVTSSDRAAADEAVYFASELKRLDMHRAAVIVNRVHPFDANEGSVAATTSRLTPMLGPRLAAKVARTHAEVQQLARRDRETLARLRDSLRDPEPICLVDRESDIRDLDGLVDLQRELFAGGRGSTVFAAS